VDRFLINNDKKIQHMPNSLQQPNMSQVFSEIEQQVKTLAETTVSNFKNEAITDAQKLVASIKSDMTRWTNLLSTGQIKITEFEFLVGSEKSVVAMLSLEQAGLAQLRVQNFLGGVLNIVIDVVLKRVVGNTLESAPII
jgi:heme oxygenase